MCSQCEILFSYVLSCFYSRYYWSYEDVRKLPLGELLRYYTNINSVIKIVFVEMCLIETVHSCCFSTVAFMYCNVF